MEGFRLPIAENLVADGIKTLLLDQQLYSRLCAEACAREFRSWSDYADKLQAHLQTQAGDREVGFVIR